MGWEGENPQWVIVPNDGDDDDDDDDDDDQLFGETCCLRVQDQKK